MGIAMKFRAGDTGRAISNDKGMFSRPKIAQTSNSVQRQVEKEQLCVCVLSMDSREAS